MPSFSLMYSLSWRKWRVGRGGPAWPRGVRVNRRQARHILLGRDRHLGRVGEGGEGGEILADPDAEGPLVLHVAAQHGHAVEGAAGPSLDGRPRDDGAVDHWAIDVGPIGIRRALQLE